MTPSKQLSLAEELLLVSLDDESGRLVDAIKPFAFEIAIAASLIMELSLKGKLDADANKLFVVSSEATGNPILDQALSTIVAKKSHLTTSDWLNRFAHNCDDLIDQIIESLVTKGILQLVEKRLLWVLKTRTYPATSGIEEREVRSRIMALLNSDEIPDPRDALLVGLLHVTGIMNRLLSASELIRLQNRIDHIANLEEMNRSLSASVQEAWELIIRQVPIIY